MRFLLLENPVFINELRQSAFRHHVRIVCAAWTILAILASSLAAVPMLYGFTVWIPVVILPLLIPAISAGAFSKEYEQQTWQDLYLTNLTNAQVVFGKFFAYLSQIMLFLLAFAPMYLFMYLEAYRSEMSGLYDTMVPITVQFSLGLAVFALMLKQVFSGVLYILLVMVCSRYSPNRRVSIVWSYIALGIYGGWGWLIWSFLGSLSDQERMSEAIKLGIRAHSELLLSSYMNGIHLIFCMVVGIGSLFLIWVSLSEQRGYKDTSKEGGVSRSWQPVLKRKG